MNELVITERRNNAVVILDLTGNIRLGDGNVILRKTLRALAEKNEKNVLLDLAGVTYVDSSGLGELVAGYTTFKKAGGELKLINLTTRVRELMVITKLLSVFAVYQTEAEGVESFSEIGDANSVAA